MKDNKLGKRIKELRDTLNMSQISFGRKIGVTGKTISAYETGKCTPPVKILERIAKIYKIPLIQLDEGQRDNLYNKINTIKDYVKDIESVIQESLYL